MLVPRILVPVDVKAAAMESSVKAPQYRRALEATVTFGSQQGAAAPHLMLVPRILVPLDAKAGIIASGGKLRTNTFVRGGSVLSAMLAALTSDD